MSQFTYEYADRSEKLETYEWDNVWWEHARTTGVPRVLYIGDSISCGTRPQANRLAEGKLFFDGFGTSKAVDNPFFGESLKLFAAQEGERSVILFNNGLHGFHLSDEGEYAACYEEMVAFLRKEFPETPIFLLLSTHVKDPIRDQRVIARNKAVTAIGEKYALPVVDLYSLTKENAHLLAPDGVHWVEEGYVKIARELLDRVKEAIR